MPGICANCGAVILAGGVKVDGKKFCRQSCASASKQVVGFCQQCMTATTEGTPGNLSRINGIGTTLMKMSQPPACKACGSVASRTWFTLLYIPVIPMAKYRVIWTTGRRFIARRLKDTAR